MTRTKTGCDDESPEDSDPSGQEPPRKKKTGTTESDGSGGPRFLQPRYFQLRGWRKKRPRLRFPEFHWQEYPEVCFRAAKISLKAARRTARNLAALAHTAARRMCERDSIARSEQHRQKNKRVMVERRQQRRDKAAQPWRPEPPPSPPPPSLRP